MSIKPIIKNEIKPVVKNSDKLGYKEKSVEEKIAEKYHIDPENFNEKSLGEWAKAHNYTLSSNASGVFYAPKYEGGFLGIGATKKTTEEEDEDFKVLSALAKNNERKRLSETDGGKLAAAVYGAADGILSGMGTGILDYAKKKEYEKAGLDEKNYVSPSEARKKTEQEHKISSFAGSFAPNVISFSGLSNAVGAATKGVGWIAKSPAWVKSAINGGITFAVQSGAETAFDGGNFEDVVKNAGINFLGGAVGGGLSAKVGQIGEKLLFDKGLQHKIIPEMVRAGAQSAAFAGGKTASAYFLYPKNHRPTKEEMAKDITAAFAFGAISSGIDTIKTSSESKKILDELYKKMALDYEKMAKANVSGKGSAAGIRKFAKNVMGYSSVMEAYLTGKEYNATVDKKTYTFTPDKVRFVGQDKYVKSVLSEINTIKNSANAVLNGIAAAPGEVFSSAVTNNAQNSAEINRLLSGATVGANGVLNAVSSGESSSSTPVIASVEAAKTVTEKSASENDYNFAISYNTADKLADNTDVTVKNKAANKMKNEEKTDNGVIETKYTHLYDEEKAGREYINSVNDEIESAVINIRNGNVEAVPDIIDVAKLTEETVKKISNFVGFNVSGYICRIERDRLLHIENRHGINGFHDHSLSDPKDTARIGYVINNSDSVDWVLDSTGAKVYDAKYNDKNNKKAPILIIKKRIDGTYAISNVVPESKRKTLWITSARIQKKRQGLDDNNIPPKATSENALDAYKADVGSQVPNGTDSAPQPTSETPLVSSFALNNIIPERGENVNSAKNVLQSKANNDIISSNDALKGVTENGGEEERAVHLRSIDNGRAGDDTRGIAEISRGGNEAFEGVGSQNRFRHATVGEKEIEFSRLKGVTENGEEEEEAVRLSSMPYGRADDDTRGISEIYGTRVGADGGIEPDRLVERIRHAAVGGGEIEFSRISKETYTKEMKAVALKNEAFGFSTEFCEGGMRIYGKDGSLSYTSPDGCYNAANKTVYINALSKEKVENISSHEKIHGVSRAFPILYDMLYKKVIVSVYKTLFEEEINAYVVPFEQMCGRKADKGKLVEEILANLSYEIFSDNPPKYVKDVEGVKKAYTVFWKDLQYLQEADGANIENVKYSVTEREALSNEQSGSGLLFGNSGRTIDESTGGQAKRVSSYKQTLSGKTRAERKSTAKELTVKGYTEEVVNGNHKYTLIKDEGYNDDMRSIVSEAKSYGIDASFFIGNTVRKFDGQRNFKIDGIKLSDNKILIRYDGVYSPQALLMHELVHVEWKKPEMQRAKEIILSDLSENEKKEILQNGRYEEYMRLYGGNEEAVWEEFVADVFANMNDFSDSCIDTAVTYWYNDKVIDRYNPSEYIKSTDAGGNDNIGFGNEYSLSGNSFDIPYNEKRQLDDYALRKNHSGNKLEKVDCKEIGNNFYVWENNSKTDYTVIEMIEIDGNEDLINERRKELKNGNIGIGKKHNVSYEGRSGNGRRSNSMLNAVYQRRRSANGNGGISSEQSTDNTVGRSKESSGNTPRYALGREEERGEKRGNLLLHANGERGRVKSTREQIGDFLQDKRGNKGRNDKKRGNADRGINGNRLYAEYTESVNSGGNDNIGFGNEYSLNNHTPRIELSKQEYALVSKAVTEKNTGKADNELKPVDFVYAADEFYVYENRLVGEFSVIKKYDAETEYERIDVLRELINNGIRSNADRERFNRIIDDVGRGKGSYSRNNGWAENGRYAMADDRVFGEQQRSNTVGYSSKIGENNGITYLHGTLGDISYSEKAQLNDYVMRKNNGGKLKKVDCKEIGNNFYVWENNSKTDYTVINIIEIDGNEDLIDILREDVQNGSFGRRERVRKAVARYNGRFGSGNRGSLDDARRGKTSGNASMVGGLRAANGRGDFDKSGGNTPRYALGREEESGEKRGKGDGGINGNRLYAEHTESVNSGKNEAAFDKFLPYNHATKTKLSNEMSEKSKEFGTIPKGENPARNVDVPKKTAKDKFVSRFARTMLEAGITPNWAVSEFEKEILSGKMTHEVIYDKQAQKWAKEQIEKSGFNEALNKWSVLVDFGKTGKKELALGMELYNRCITNKDTQNAMKIAAELAAEATNAAQTLQATRMLKKMNPDGKLYCLEKNLKKINEGLKKRYGEDFSEIELDFDLAAGFLNAEDEAKRDEIYEAICSRIAKKIPASSFEKWNAWRHLSMLGNIRTHMRNIAGNAAFVPAVRLKNYIGAVIESTAKINPEVRKYSVKKTKEAKAFAEADFEKMEKILASEGAKYAETDKIAGRRTIFKIKWLEALRRKNFEFLEAEDMWFLKAHYKDALARLITVRKVDAEVLTPEALEILRAYAVKEATEATFRDANALADGINKIEKRLAESEKITLKFFGALIEGVMPYKKTPLNILKQGINYSPIGLLKGVLKLIRGINGKNAEEALESFTKGLTGLSVMLLGFWLASMGLLNGSSPKSKREREFKKTLGEQSYALNINGASYTLDWMTPVNFPLFAGASLFEMLEEDEAFEDFSFKDVALALSNLSEPLFELSVFSGINDTVKSAGYGEGAEAAEMLADMAESYVLQALPTMGGQLSRIIDKNKREYYFTDENSQLPKPLQRFLGQAAAKTPFASYLFEPKINVWGKEEVYGGLFERILENGVSPGNFSKENYAFVNKEIKRLYEKTGDKAVLPATQAKYFTVDKKQRYMTAKELTKAKKLRGKKSFELVCDLLYDVKKVKIKDENSGKITSKYYSEMTDGEKISAVKKCYTEAGEQTKEEMLN